MPAVAPLVVVDEGTETRETQGSGCGLEEHRPLEDKHWAQDSQIEWAAVPADVNDGDDDDEDRDGNNVAKPGQLLCAAESATKAGAKVWHWVPSRPRFRESARGG